MKKKDLAEEYLDRKIKQEPFKSLTKGFENAFSVDDIKAAFNAGRDSVMESLPELEWRKEICRDKYFLEAYALGAYYLIILRGSEFHVACNYRHFASYTSLTAAKQAANEDYKKRIKQALGL
jgi:hypothetical protein